jgi:hypothetical protein
MEYRPRVAWTTFMWWPAAKLGGRAVAQVVQPDGGQAGEVGDLGEGVGDVGGVRRGAVGAGELESGVGPGVSGVFFLFLLPLAVDADAGAGVGVEGDLPFPGVGFRGALGGLPAELGDLPPDGGDVAAQVGARAGRHTRGRACATPPPRPACSPPSPRPCRDGPGARIVPSIALRAARAALCLLHPARGDDAVRRDAGVPCGSGPR